MRPTWLTARGIRMWDLGTALALTLLSQAELASLGRSSPLTVTLSLTMTLALVFKSAAPLATALVVIGTFGSQALVLDPAPSVLGHGLALLVAFFGAGAGLGPWRSLPLLALGVVATLVFEQDQGNVGAAAGDMVMALAAWGIGLLTTRRRHESEARLRTAEEEVQQAEVRVEAALAAERQRVARELHDVVSHAITVVVLQARGAKAVMHSDPAAAQRALDAIEVSGQEALGEMRRLVTFLREAPDPAPQPGVSDIPALIEATRREVPVTFEVVGEPHTESGLGHGAGLTAYRLIQECLTNALRHAPGAPVAVRVERSPTGLVIDVSNPVATSEPDHQPGFGLIGMRERAELYGGTLEYGRQDGTWRVRCRLPTEMSATLSAPEAESVR